MVVTIVQPTADSPWGPGFLVSLNSDFVGPLAVPSSWEIEVFTLDDLEQAKDQEFRTTTTNAASWTFGLALPEFSPFVRAELGLSHGSTVRVKATLRSSTTVVDTGTVDVTWDMVSGVPVALQELIAQARPNLTGLESDTASIDQAVHMSFPGLPNLPIGEFLGIPLAGGAERVLITPDRTGEGTLDRQVGLVDVAAVGIEWEVVSAPAGVGVAQGAPDRWVRRVLDLQLVGTDASSNEYTRTYDSFHVDHYRLMFQGFGLTRLHYWIEPGITIRFWWLVFGI